MEEKGDQIIENTFEAINEKFDDIIDEEKDERMDLDMQTKYVPGSTKRQKVEVDVYGPQADPDWGGL